MNFRKAMSTKCPECNARAAHHRLTPSGVLYCLALNVKGRQRRDFLIKRGEHYDTASIHHLPVKYLKKSPLPPSVGKSIREGISTYLSSAS